MGGGGDVDACKENLCASVHSLGLVDFNDQILDILINTGLMYYNGFNCNTCNSEWTRIVVFSYNTILIIQYLCCTLLLCTLLWLLRQLISGGGIPMTLPRPPPECKTLVLVLGFINVQTQLVIMILKIQLLLYSSTIKAEKSRGELMYKNTLLLKF